MSRLVLSIIAVCLVPFVAAAAPITPNNAGFETGNLTGWTATGTVSVGGTTVIPANLNNWVISPSGSFMAILQSQSISISQLEIFFGLPGGTIGGAIGSATVGSGIKQDITGNAGDTVTMYWAFAATDYTPYNDTGFAVGGSTVTPLACITGGCTNVTGSYGAAGWFSHTFTLPSDGTHTLGFGVVNTGDSGVDSYFFLDNAPGQLFNSSGVIPEPATIVLLGAGLLGLGVLHRRRRA